MIIYSTIQKEIVDACTKETIKVIIKDLDGDYFGILIDESKDISHKEQMTLVYCSKKLLQKVIYALLSDHSLSLSRFCGQGYDGANNMTYFENTKLRSWVLKSREILTGQGLNKKRGLQRLGDTCWGSHFKTLENFMIIFFSIANVFKDMKEDSPHDFDILASRNLLDKI
ncbi:hypothetical protein H5410_029935 [Solanum commersonii]|uniref:DUF4371 domain-containing protein n=1 Tax=Solanum commersonii TaxID=4109 RepID=A0A9J5YEP5_SOLCO|nr:hypothetical protein H5410_029935 [Solanum commersonii]